MRKRISREMPRLGLVAIALIALAILALSSSTLNIEAQTGPWEGQYWNNRDLSGSPALTRQDANIDFDWGGGSPAVSINADNFSAQWTQTANLPAGTYRFTATTDDGMRVWVDNVLIIDSWFDSQAHTITADVYLGSGNHTVTVQYYEAGGVAVARMSYGMVTAPPPPPSAQAFLGEYFANDNLSGSPALVRNDAVIDFNWGTGSPATNIPADNFSVRWTRTLTLDAGRYRFTTTTDDGVRLWINNSLIIDRWQVQAPTSHSGEIDLPGGAVTIKMEYFERTERAVAQLTWVRLSAPPPPPPPTSGAWRADFFNNTSLSGPLAFAQDVASVNFNWGFGSPAPQVQADNFSARFSTTQALNAGTYRFTVTSDDGVRVFVNNQLIIDGWREQAATTYTADHAVPGGNTTIRVEYFELTGLAEIRFSYGLVGSTPGTGGPFPGVATVTAYRLNVRSQPNASAVIIGKLSQGQVVALTGFRNAAATWVQIVQPNGVPGWVNASYVVSSVPISSLTPIGTTPPPQPPPTTSATGIVTAGLLNVRSGPSTAYGVLTTIPNGTFVTLQGRNGAATWARIIVPGGLQGWVNASYLSTSVPVASLPVLAP